METLKHYDMIRGMAVDYMHCCLLGVIRRLLNLWLNSENRNKPYYIGHLTTLKDRRLLNIKQVSELSRVPRSITDRAYWKTSEYRLFLLYYSLQIMKELTHTDFIRLLVTSLRKLLGTPITSRDLSVCAELITILCKHCSTL